MLTPIYKNGATWWKHGKHGHRQVIARISDEKRDRPKEDMFERVEDLMESRKRKKR